MGDGHVRLGYLLAVAREVKGMTLRDLAKASGISNAMISQIETGKVKNPSFATVVELADCLGLPLDRVASTVRRFKDTSMLRSKEVTNGS